MNTTELTGWLKEQGCTVNGIPGDAGRYLVKITGSGTRGSYLYFSAPVSDKPVQCYTICNICDQLNIPVPESCSEHVKLAEIIKGKYY